MKKYFRENQLEKALGKNSKFEEDKMKNRSENEKSLVERFLESYYGSEKPEKVLPKRWLVEKRTRLPYKEYRLMERISNGLKKAAANSTGKNKKNHLRERVYDAIQLVPPYSIGDEIAFIDYGKKWQGKIIDLYHYGEEKFIYTVEDARCEETKEMRTFFDILDSNIIEDVIS